MLDLLQLLIAGLAGAATGEFLRWEKERRGWHECPISTCGFKMKVNTNITDRKAKDVIVEVMTDHILRFHHVDDHA